MRVTSLVAAVAPGTGKIIKNSLRVFERGNRGPFFPDTLVCIIGVVHINTCLINTLLRGASNKTKVFLFDALRHVYNTYKPFLGFVPIRYFELEKRICKILQLRIRVDVRLKPLAQPI